MLSSSNMPATSFDILALITSVGEMETLSAVLPVLSTNLPTLLVVSPSSEAMTQLERLRSRTQLPVHLAENGMALRPGHLYVSPPHLILEVRPDSCCTVTAPRGELSAERPLDRLLASLAVSFSTRALTVILDGDGNDGLVGVQALHGTGATVLVQRSNHASLTDLPHAVIEAGAVDLVLTRQQLGHTITDLLEGKPLLQLRGVARPEEILRSEERFRLLVAASSDMVYRMSADWSKMHSLVGKGILADTTNPNLTWLEMYIPDSERKYVQAAIDQAVRTKTVFELEHRVVQEDGTVGWTLSRAIPFLDEYGEIVEWFGSASDITEHKHAERQQAFLLKLSDALRPLVKSAELEHTTTQLLGQELGANRVFYATIDTDGETWSIQHDYADGVPSCAGRYSMSEFQRQRLARWQTGQVSSVADSDTDPTLSAVDRAAYVSFDTRAAIGVPLVRGGRFAALLSVNHSEPRIWSEAELELTREVAERTWMAIEHIRSEEALRDSQMRLRLALDAAQMGTFLWYPQEDRAEMDARIVTLYGLRERETFNLAEALATLIHPDDRELYATSVARAVDPNSDGRLEMEFRVVYPDGSLHWLQSEGQAFFSHEAPSRATLLYGLVRDINERKRHEANLAFLAEVSEALAGLTNVDETMQALTEKIGVYFSAAVSAFSEVDEAAGTVTSLNIWHHKDAVSPTGVFRLKEYHSEDVRQLMRSGRPEIVRDTASFSEESAARYTALKVGAYVNTPLVREGQWRLTLSVTDTKARDWREDELVLMRELTTRIWTRIERAHAEDAVRVLNATLEKRVEERTRRLADLNAELGNFITRTAHNLEAPARQLSYLLNPEHTHDLQALGGLPSYDPIALSDEVTRLKGVARDLRQLSTLEGQPFTRELIPLVELFADVRAEVSTTSLGNQVTWLVEPLPIVRGDRKLLRQALEVLMTFTLSETRGARYVTVSSRHIEGEVQVTVQDDGIGLTGEEAATLFDLAVRTAQDVPVLEGSGLVQVRRILSRHGGWAWAESQLTSGKVVLAFPKDETVNDLEALFRQDKPGM